MRTATRSIITTLMLSILGIAQVMLATPSTANDTSCARGRSCLWEDKHYDGSPWFEKGGPGTYNTGWSHNDDASSVWNRQADVSFVLYDDTNQDATHGTGCVPRKYGTGNIENYEFEDRVSSMRITTAYCSNIASVIIGGKKSNY